MRDLLFWRTAVRRFLLLPYRKLQPRPRICYNTPLLSTQHFLLLIIHHSSLKVLSWQIG
jgi:hypothetical protein